MELRAPLLPHHELAARLIIRHVCRDQVQSGKLVRWEEGSALGGIFKWLSEIFARSEEGGPHLPPAARLWLIALWLEVGGQEAPGPEYGPDEGLAGPWPP